MRSHEPKTTLTLLAVLAVAAGFGGVPTAAEEAEQPELGWPREYAGEDWRMVVYQPQIEEWEDYLRMEAYLAVLLTPPGDDEPVAGAVKLAARTDTHMDTRTVFIHDVELLEIRFPEIEGLPEERIAEIVRSTFPDKPVAHSLDRVLAGISKTKIRTREVKLNDQPPTIFVSQKKAVLMVIDGEPAWVPTGVDNLTYAANTNWDLFKLDKGGKESFYLRDKSTWLSAKKLEGPWGPAGKLPKAFKKLPMNDNFRNARLNVPGKKLSADRAPRVFVSKEPAELILIEGEPELAPIPDTPLLWVENTESDLFRHIDDGHYYYLVAGRWFKTPSLEGGWSAATGELPEGFADIPEDHAKGAVLAAVPGTPQADEAVLQAQIPTVAQVSRADAPREVKVEYVGEPKFREIEGTKLAYAVNTSSDVVRLGDTYYLCHAGVWFVSKQATGPWSVADSVPDEIYEIPADSPVHHTTYVYVYDSTPETVYYGYTPGYMGMYVAWGCVVWGTGYYYNPYYYYDPFYYPYPIYYGYPYTYGAGAWYNPATGFYGRGYAYYGPYGGAGAAAAYNPRTGTYARGGYAYGAGGGTAWGRAYNPRTGTAAAGYRSYDAYSSWGQGVVSRGDQWLKGGYYSDARGSVRGFRTSEGTGAAVVDRGGSRTGVVKGEDNLYVGKDGNVYRRGQDGWYQYGGRDDGWGKVADPASAEQREAARQRVQGATPEQRQAARDRAGSARGGGSTAGAGSVVGDLDRTAAARSRGSYRAGNYGSWQSGGGWSSGSRGRSAGGGRSMGGRGRRR